MLNTSHDTTQLDTCEVRRGISPSFSACVRSVLCLLSPLQVSTDACRYFLVSDSIRSTPPANAAGLIDEESNRVVPKPSAWIKQPAHTKRHQPFHYGLTSGAWLSRPGVTGAGHGVVPRLPKDSVNDRLRTTVLYRTCCFYPSPRTGFGYVLHQLTQEPTRTCLVPKPGDGGETIYNDL